MKTRFAVATLLGVVGLALPRASAVLPPKVPALPNYDQRAAPGQQSPATPAQAASLGPAQAQAEARLKSAVPGASISRDRILGTPRLVTATRGFLTGPGGRGNSISQARLDEVPAGDPHRVIKAFLNEHSALFGFDADALSSARVQRDYVTAHNGLRTTTWQQTLDGIPVFEALLVGHVTRGEELVSLSGVFVPDAASAANRGTPNRRALAGNPTISAARAVALASANIGLTLPEDSVTITTSPEGDEKRQNATADGLIGTASANLVWLPMDPQSMRLCWRVILGSRTTLEHYSILLDADSGAVLVRHSLTAHIGPASYNVYTSDSPSPFSPGWPTPQSEQPSNTARVLVTLSALDTNASPAGWIPDGDNRTSGNNAIAFLDRDLNGVQDGPLPQGTGAGRVFDFPLNLTNAPLSYADASTVQLFYRANWYHDRLYQLGFTEAAGNFQTNNFGRGGFGNDNVIALVQAGADVGFTDNAAFSTPPDGQNGYCFMFVFTGPDPDRDGSLDQEVVIHEFTHGLSNRLLGGGVGISALQTAGMGEGWSDFYSLCLLSEATDDVNAVYAEGGYVTYLFADTGMDQNYYYGIRRYPYSTDMNKNPLTFKDIDPTRFSTHVGVPISPIFGATFPAEVHNQGEVWCMTLREVWANLVSKFGWSVGNELVLQLVTDGLKLAPANATFLEARDAIITADEVLTGGENALELWQGFAKRGMGYSAVCPPSDTTVGVLESFDLPPGLANPDGILEVTVTPSSLEAMIAGETNVIQVRVTDALIVTNAVVNATLSTGTNLTFRNDGVAPDARANNAVYTALLLVPTNLSSISITMVISAPGKDTNTTVVTYFIVPLPPNDNFTNSIKVAAAGAEIFTSNKRATIELNEPMHASISTVAASLWWNYTPSANTNVLVDAGNSSFRTVVAVYTNQTLTTLQPVASAAGTVNRLGAFVKFNAQAGRTYRVAVASYDSSSVGTVNLNIAPGGLPDTNAPVVTISSPVNGQIVLTNRLLVTGSAADPSPNASGIRDITIRVTPIAGAVSTTVITPSLTGPLNTNWSSIVGLQPGFNNVTVSATDFAGNVSPGTSIQVTYRALDPPNDFFGLAGVLTGVSGTNSANTTHASKEVGEPNHAGIAGGKSVWWFFTPSADGMLTLSTTNSTFDTVMALYTGPDVSHLTGIASNDDAFDGAPLGFSRIVQAVRSNQTYRVAVDGYDGGSGVVFLTWSLTPATIYHLTLAAAAGGSVAPPSGDFASNTVVVATATPNPNYAFSGWDGSVVSANNPLTITVSSNMSLTAHFTIIPITDDFETGDLSHVNWTTNGPAVGNKPWFVQSSVVQAGQFAARSGTITHNQTSSLLLTGYFNSGNGTFNYRVSSEPTFDTLKFLLDGVPLQTWSGEVAWASFTFPLSAGNHTLEWRYSKDASGNVGLDAAFIDNVNLPMGVAIDSTSAAYLQLARQTNNAFVLSLLGQTNQQYIIQVSTNLTSWSNVYTNRAVNGVILFTDPPPAKVIQYYRAVVSP